MNSHKSLQVFWGEKKVGTLAVAKNHLVMFEYDGEWLEKGVSISPFSLPLQKGVFSPRGYDPFEGLFGVFADSLPDGWGRLLADRLLRKEGLEPAKVDSLNRLAIVGDTGMGVLRYQPEEVFALGESVLSLDELAAECRQIFDSKDSNSLDELFRLGGSSGGARPKIFYKIDGEDWIVKFPASMDIENIGVQEYEYSLCAKKCGINMPETRLIASDICPGYFAVKRFDRNGPERFHIISVSGLLETSHRIPNLDYDILMQLTLQLTKSYEEVEKMFRLMCFNVFSHNRDDHSKNFSFQYGDTGWKLSPAYDLTYSNSIGGEHATTVHGNGVNPGMKEILKVAEKIKFDSAKAIKIASEIREITAQDLKQWLKK